MRPFTKGLLWAIAIEMWFGILIYGIVKVVF